MDADRLRLAEYKNMQFPKCKICRRLGVKLFLKGDKCGEQKCPIIRKPYPPGPQRKRRSRNFSEYKRELIAKQKLKNWYNLSERQFRNYVEEVLEKKGKMENAAARLIKKIENRFDNTIFRLGFGISRPHARQLVSHGHFLINGRPVNIASFQLKKGDKINVHPSSQKLPAFKEYAVKLKKHKLPLWLKLDIKSFEAEVIGDPSVEEASPPAEISTIFEYYSR